MKPSITSGIGRKILATLLAFTLMFGVFAPMTAYAAGASDLKTTIESYTGGTGAKGFLAAAVSGSTVTVTGTMTGVTEPLTMFIDPGVTVVWQAKMSGTSTLISISNSSLAAGGALRIAPGAELVSSGVNTIFSGSWMGSIVVQGGTVSNTYITGYAIFSTTSGIKVTVSGGEVIAKGGYAINARYGTVSISGGLVFCHGTTSPSSVISIYEDSKLTISAPAAVVAWNNSGAYYLEGASTGLTISPAQASAKWGKDTGGNPGIVYRSQGYEGFLPIGGVTVAPPSLSGLKVNGTGNYTTVSSAKSAIESALGSDTAVTVTGGLLTTSELTLAIPSGKTVIWMAALHHRSYGINLTGSGTFEVTDGAEIKTTSDVAASSHSIRLIGASAKLNITGGLVSSGRRDCYPISASGGNTSAHISGGIVEATAGARAISMQEATSTVTVSGTGVVRLTNGNSSDAIYSSGTVNVQGGEVSATGYNTCAICGSGGSAVVTVSGGVVSANASGSYGTIWTTNSSGSITVSGTGKVVATGIGNAIMSIGNVKVEGGEVSATTGYAVYGSGASAAVTVSSGRVFAYGAAVTGSSNVIHTPFNASGFSDATGTSVVIAWNQGAGVTSYATGATTHISISPASATAVWATNGTKHGISYTNGSNTGFIPLAVTVTGAADPAPELSAGTATRTGETQASIGFTTSEAGTAYYKIVEKNAAAPDFDASSWISIGPVSGTVTDKSVTLTAGAKDIYVVVADISGNASDALKIPVGAIYPQNPVPTIEVYVGGHKYFRGDDIVDGATDIDISEIITAPDPAIAKALGQLSDLGDRVRLSGIAVGTTSIVVAVDGMDITVPISVVEPPEGLKPVLSAGTASRTSDTKATLGFNTSKAGYVFYLVKDAEEDAPVIPDDFLSFEEGGLVEAGEVSLPVALTAGAKDVYVLLSGETYSLPSNLLKIEVPAYGAIGTAPAITTTALSGGTVGTPYNEALEATGDAPISWSLDGGSLPDGLTLDGVTGVISGTPTAAGTANFIIKANNGTGNDTKTLSITINAATPTVEGVAVFPLTADVQKGATQQFGASVTGTHNPATTVTWSLYGYSGSSTISDSGLLTVAAGETETALTVRATSTVDPAKYGEATVTVTDSPPTPVYGISLEISGTHVFPAATEGYGAQTPLSITVTNTGNQETGSLSVALSSADESSFTASPDTINSIATATDATFTITPETGLSTGTHTATVTVSGGNGISESLGVSFTVNPATPSGTAPTITTADLPNGTVGTAYSKTLAATGGTPITWTLDSGSLPDGLMLNETTGVISGTPTAAGTVNFTVKAANGAGSDTKALSITIASAGTTTYALTVSGGTGGGSYTAGAQVTITAGAAPSGKVFDKWTGGNGGTFANANSAVTTFTMPGNAAAVTATYKDRGGNGGGDGYTPPSPPITPEKKPDQPVTATTPVTATAGANGSASANIPASAITDAIARAQADARAQGNTANGISVELNVTMPQGATSLTATIPQSALQSLVTSGVSQLEISGAPVSLSLNQRALQSIQSQASGGITISITPAPELSASVRAVIGNRPVYHITISYTDKDGKTHNITSLGSGTATLAIPYTPGRNEAAGYLYGVYVDGNGNVTRIPDSVYDANRRSILVLTNHFSVYGVGYTAPSAKFTDIGSHWAKDSIDYVVGRGLLSGTSKTTFAPNTAMTRGMLVTALGRLAGVDTKAYTKSSFTDVKADSAFRPYIEWARSKGIVQGIGNGQFAPDRAITREEIAVIFANFAKSTGYKLPVTRTAAAFADAASIGSAYKDAVMAMQQAGIMMGETNNRFNPKSNATRAEVSAMLHRYIKLTIDPSTAQGWAKNDDGQYLYYKDGKALTGTQTIDGAKYFFNADGTLKTGWVKDGGNWRYYSGNKAAVGWLDISDKRYYFTKDGLMVSGKWLQLDGKWYYFYADGSLAKNTKVDGYEVDNNGVRKAK